MGEAATDGGAGAQTGLTAAAGQPASSSPSGPSGGGGSPGVPAGGPGPAQGAGAPVGPAPTGQPGGAAPAATSVAAASPPQGTSGYIWTQQDEDEEEAREAADVDIARRTKDDPAFSGPDVFPVQPVPGFPGWSRQLYGGGGWMVYGPDPSSWGVWNTATNAWEGNGLAQLPQNFPGPPPPDD
jgi:hypothetical protein